MARVSASVPSWSCDGPGDAQDPRPRLQSMRTATTPAVSKLIVYLSRSSGVRTCPSLPSNLTSCHDVPARLGAWTVFADGSEAHPEPVNRDARSNPGPNRVAPTMMSDATGKHVGRV